jgi:murein DD-endopeptidase MepM/ murein hydrolase activator NlpD
MTHRREAPEHARLGNNTAYINPRTNGVVYRRNTKQLVPLATSEVVVNPRPSSWRVGHLRTRLSIHLRTDLGGGLHPMSQRLLRRKQALWPFAAAGLAFALAWTSIGAAFQTHRAEQLEYTLRLEREAATAVQRSLVEEAAVMSSRNSALEEDLRAIEEETERLYDVVHAMRALGEQLRERVGLSGPVLEALPELAPRSGLVIARAPLEADGPSGASPGGVAAMLPPNTGPWPNHTMAHLVYPPDDRVARVARAGEAITRQWDSWQQLGQSIDQILGQQSRAARPSIRPAYGPITSGFGRRAGFWGALAYHTGIDISLPIGSLVVATANGTVTFSGFQVGYGYTVQIRHEGGLSTLYGHLSRPLVHAGQQVAQGQVIALSGNSGISTGPHLHYEIRLNGTPVDPTRYW